MTSDIQSGFAETARGRVYFEVSGPAGAPALIFFGLQTTKGVAPEIGLGYHEGLASDYRFLICDYPVGVGASERYDDPPPMTPDQVAADYIAIADAAGFDRFACAGYSVGGNTSIQLAVRHPTRLTALVVGGWPALGGDFKACFEICGSQRGHIEADTALGQLYADNPKLRTAAAATAEDFVNYYEALQDWDDRGTAQSLEMPRLNFADAEDLAYPANNASIDIGPALMRNEAELREMGWETQIVRTGAGADGSHIAAVRADIGVPILREFLGRVLRRNP